MHGMLANNHYASWMMPMTGLRLCNIQRHKQGQDCRSGVKDFTDTLLAPSTAWVYEWNVGTLCGLAMVR